MLRSSGRTACTGLLLGSASLLLGCRPDLVVRAATRVFHDGGIERRVELHGRPADPKEEIGKDWLAETVGLHLARPQDWDRVEVEADRVRAWGFFARAEDVPPAFTYRTGHRERDERSRTSVEIEERALLRRFAYREEHGDPFSPAEAAAAIDRLLDLASEAFQREVARDLGEGVDPRRAVERLRSDLRAIVVPVLVEPRTRRVPETEAEKRERWTALLRERGAPVAAAAESEDFWELQAPDLLEWSRARLAESLSTPDRPIGPESLAFWPAGQDWSEDLTAIAERTWGDSSGLDTLVEDELDAIEGYFGNAGSPRVRFEVRVELPGTLLRTNGTPDGDATIWLVRAEDLVAGDTVLEATSVETLDEPLSEIGARKVFDRAELLQLTDLLWERDAAGVLAGLLVEARRVGHLGPLRDVDRIPDEWEAAARELSDLLAVTRPPAIGGLLGAEPLEPDGAVVGEAHRLGDRTVTGFLRDQPVQ